MNSEKQPLELEITEIYKQFSTFVLSLTSLLLSLVFVYSHQQNPTDIKMWIALGLLFLFYVSLLFVVGSVLGYYVTKSHEKFRPIWNNHKWKFLIAALVVSLVVFAWIAYYRMSADAFWATILGSAVTGVGYGVIWIIREKIVKKQTPRTKR